MTVKEAAALLKVSQRTIRRRIATEKLPHLKLPSGQYRIPQTSLLASLSSNYRLAEELAQLDDRFADVTENQVRSALSDDAEST